MHGPWLTQVFQTYDRDGNNNLELAELMAMCRQLSGLSYTEACFVQAMLDADLNNRVSFQEFVDGVKRATATLDDMTRWVHWSTSRSATVVGFSLLPLHGLPPGRYTSGAAVCNTFCADPSLAAQHALIPHPRTHSTERDVLHVLSTASAAISRDLDVFWSTYTTHDTDRNGYLDMSEMSRFFKALFSGIGAYEARVLVAFAYMMDVEKDGLVRPDDLLQALRAIPLRSPTGVLYKPGFKVPPPRPGTPGARAAGLDLGATNPKARLAWQPSSQIGDHVQQQAQLGSAGGSGLWRMDSNLRASYDSAIMEGGPFPGAASSYATQYPYPQPPSTPLTAQALAGVTPSPSNAQPYMLSQGPGQPPLVGYIIPYQQVSDGFRPQRSKVEYSTGTFLELQPSFLSMCPLLTLPACCSLLRTCSSSW